MLDVRVDLVESDGGLGHSVKPFVELSGGLVGVDTGVVVFCVSLALVEVVLDSEEAFCHVHALDWMALCFPWVRDVLARVISNSRFYGCFDGESYRSELIGRDLVHDFFLGEVEDFFS